LNLQLAESDDKADAFRVLGLRLQTSWTARNTTAKEKAMSAQRDRQPNKEKPRGRVRDLPGCIKYFILLFLILLLLAEIYSGEFRRLGEGNWLAWLILLIKLLLIAVLLWLIKVQRSLNCDLTAPTGCTEEEPDPVAGNLFVRVKGTASGTVFGHYTLEVWKGGISYPGIVSYPSGGASGTAPVINGELGRINTTGLMDATYEIKLTVFPIGAGSPCIHTITFDLLKVVVYLGRIGKIPVVVPPANRNPFDPAAELRKDFAPHPPALPVDYELVSVGGRLSVEGSAYIYECAGRKIKNYEIRYGDGELPQPATDAAIPASWPIANRIEFLEYPTPDHYQPWTRVGPASRDLMNSFTSMTIGGTTYFKLDGGFWYSSGSGRLTLLLTAEDTTAGPHRYHDIQKIWLDNKQTLALISGIKNVKPCAELSLSQFVGALMTILGIAWDPLIDDALPQTSPNDNFNGYNITLYKQGGGSHAVGGATTRVPTRKTGAPPVISPPAAVVEAGTLADFDIATVLDGGNAGSDPAVSIPRNTGCAYYLWLDVSDKTRVDDDAYTHSASSIWPFCIVNDIK